MQDPLGAGLRMAALILIGAVLCGAAGIWWLS